LHVHTPPSFLYQRRHGQMIWRLDKSERERRKAERKREAERLCRAGHDTGVMGWEDERAHAFDSPLLSSRFSSHQCFAILTSLSCHWALSSCARATTPGSERHNSPRF
jgi:hypothetical protein